MAFTAVTSQLAIAFVTQDEAGVFDDAGDTLEGITTSLTTANGLILGATGQGVRDSGISYANERGLIEKAPVAGLTLGASDFVKEEVATLTFAFPFSGNKADTTVIPIDTDFKLSKTPGIEALLLCCGIGGGVTSATPGWTYKMVNTAVASCMLWDSGERYGLKDVSGNISINYTPGETPIATCTLSGTVETIGTITMAQAVPSTLTYTPQDSVTTPIVETVANVWTQDRGFVELTVTVNNAIETINDSNELGGTRQRQGGRTVEVSGEVYSHASDIDMERDTLILTTAPTADMVFQVGKDSPGVGGSPAVAHKVTLANVEVRSREISAQGIDRTIVFDGICTAASDGDECTIEFR